MKRTRSLHLVATAVLRRFRSDERAGTIPQARSRLGSPGCASVRECPARVTSECGIH